MTGRRLSWILVMALVAGAAGAQLGCGASPITIPGGLTNPSSPCFFAPTNTLYFEAAGPGAWRSLYSSTWNGSGWGAPVQLTGQLAPTPANPQHNMDPHVVIWGGQTVMFTTAGISDLDLFTSVNGAPPIKIVGATVNTPAPESDPFFFPPTSELFYTRAGNICVATTAQSAPLLNVANVFSQTQTVTAGIDPSLSPDGLTLYYKDNTVGIVGFYSRTRPTFSAPWGAPQLVSPLPASPSAAGIFAGTSPQGAPTFYWHDATGLMQQSCSWQPISIPGAPTGLTSPCFFASNNTLYFEGNGASGWRSLWSSTWLAGGWGPAVQLIGQLAPTPANPQHNEDPHVVSWGLATVLFTTAGITDLDLFTSVNGAAPRKIIGATVNTPAPESDPYFFPGSKELFYTRGGNIYRAVTTQNGPLGNAADVFTETGLVTNGIDPSLSPDGLTLYYKDNTAGSVGFYQRTRTTFAAPWGGPQPVSQLPTSASAAGIFAGSSPQGVATFYWHDAAGLWQQAYGPTPFGQANSACASLVVNGLGATAAGPFSVSVPAGTTLSLNWLGAPNQPLALIATPALIPGQNVGGLMVDVNLGSFVVMFSGFDPLTGPLYFTSGAGAAQQAILVPTLAAGATINVQGVIWDQANSCSGGLGVMTTASFTINF